MRRPALAKPAPGATGRPSGCSFMVPAPWNTGREMSQEDSNPHRINNMNAKNILNSRITRFAGLLALLTALTTPGWAQTTATWLGGVDTDWNTAGNWDTLDVPGIGTNAMIGGGYTVNYSAPMAVTNFAGVNNGGTLTVSAAGFTIDALGTLAAYTGNGGSLLQVNSGGVVVATNSGAIMLTTDSAVAVQGGVLVITNSTGNINFGVNANNNGAGFTNNGGVVVFSQPFQSKGRYSRFEMHGGSLSFLGGGGIFESSNDQERKFLIDGGTANLGNFSIARTLNTVGSAGLVISNGTVNVTSLQVGTGVAASGATVYGGVLTNTGTFTISDRTNAATSGTRRAIFYVRGGTVVSTAPTGIVVANQPNNSNTGGSSVWAGVLDINSGTIVAEKLTLVGPNAVTNAYATLTLAGSGAIYLGSGGLVGNVGYSNTAYTMTLSGGTLGAKADYSIVGNGTLSGTLTVKAADLANNPYNITNTGVWSGTGGSLAKTGGGVLTLTKNNTYSGTTTISEGTLALASTGSISNSSQISVASGATLDVSAVSGAALLGSQILSGSGAVNGSMTALSGSTLRPGGLLAAGTLTFSNSLTQAGSVTTAFDLSDDPIGKPNDFLNILGDLNLSGTNTMSINALGATPAAGTVYKLIQYGGNFNGGLTNFQLANISGSLSNNVSGKTIDLVVQSSTRAATNVTWLGGLGGNAWDTIATANWLNGAARDIFVSGDNVRFDDTGATNPIVTLVGSVSSSATVVETASNYTFTGSGTLDGTGSLTKTNSGTLTILTANNGYSGSTIIGGGILEVSKLASGSLLSGIGSSSSDPASLVFYGTTLRYLGGNVASDRGATLNGAGATIEVTNAAAALTLSGTLTGSGALAKTGPGTLILSGNGGYAGPTTVSNGTLQVNSAISAVGTNEIIFVGGTVALNVSGQQTYANALNVLAASGLNSAGGNNNVITGPWSGSGTLNLSIATNGTFTINKDMTTSFTGTIALGNSDGFFRFNAGGSSSGAQQSTGSPAATFDLGTGYATLLNRNGGNTTYYLGGLAGGPDTSVRGSSNAGSPNTYQVGDNNASTAFAGTIANGGGGSAALVSLLKAGTGTLTLEGTNTYGGETTISNGVLALSGYGAIRSTPTITLLSGAVLDASGRTDGALVLNSGQTLLGEGEVRGSVNIRSNATVSPGPSAGVIGKLTITNALTLQPGGILLMDVDHSSATNDVIEGLASVTYGGTLSLNPYSVDLTSRFKLFSATSYSGAFDLITPVSPGAGWVWDVSSLAVDGTLKVKTFVVTQPNITTASVAGTDLTLSGTGGPAYLSYTVYASSDVSLPLASWIAVGTGNFKGDGSFVLTIPFDTSGFQQFYAVQYTGP